MQLNERVEEFQALGVNIAAISYDPYLQNSSFVEEQDLKYPILADQNADTVKGFGILNQEYAEGHPAYGIPHPGIIFVLPDATIQFKRAVPGYKERPNLDELVLAVREATVSS